MILFFKSWCEGIIVAIIISIIIESIVPEGNMKKYVKVVIGIYVVFTILNPILGKIDMEIDLNKFANYSSIQTSTPNIENIKELYTNGINETLKNNIEDEFGYCVSNIQISYDENYENIESISLKIQDSSISKIEKVQIGNYTNDVTSEKDFDEIKNYISENYKIDKSKIFIN